jgi:hypothetical protein
MKAFTAHYTTKEGNNMVKTIRLKDADKIVPGYDDYPNISVTGSLRGMRDMYGYNLKLCVRIGGYYYHLKGYPNIEKILEAI